MTSTHRARRSASASWARASSDHAAGRRRDGQHGRDFAASPAGAHVVGHRRQPPRAIIGGWPGVLLLVPSATYRARDFLDAARALGVEVVVGTEEAHALQGLMGPGRSRCPSTTPSRGGRAIVAHDASLPLDAVVAVDDMGTVVAAEASDRLGLRHNPPDAVRRDARQARHARRCLAALEVPQPAFAALRAGAGHEDGGRGARRAVGLPCVIKPTTLSGSQGVLRADTPEEAVAVAARVRRIADRPRASTRRPPARRAIRRRGPRWPWRGSCATGELPVLAVFDKPDPLDGPGLRGDHLRDPVASRHRPTPRPSLAATAAATAALGLVDGPGPRRAARRRRPGLGDRGGGAHHRRPVLADACRSPRARSLEELVIAHALGLPLGADRAPRRERRACSMVPIPRAGTLLGVDGQDRGAVRCRG